MVQASAPPTAGVWDSRAGGDQDSHLHGFLGTSLIFFPLSQKIAAFKRKNDALHKQRNVKTDNLPYCP